MQRQGHRFHIIALHELDAASLRTIDTWVIIADKGASHAQRLEVQKVMPWATFISKGGSLKRHPISMNLLAVEPPCRPSEPQLP